MRKTSDPIEPGKPSDKSNSAMRPVGQRLIAGLLAVTLTLSGCGGAFDSQQDAQSDSAPTLDSATIKADNAKLSASLELVEADAATDTSGEGAPSDGAVTKALRCSHTYRFYLNGLSDWHKDNIRKMWTEVPVGSTTKRPVTLSHGHPEFSYKREHVMPYVDNYIDDSQRSLLYSIKFDQISGSSARWTFSTTSTTTNQANCTTMKRRLTQVDQGDEQVLEGPGGFVNHPEFVRAASWITASAITVAATVIAVGLAPEAVAAWGGAIVGCLVGTGMGIGMAALTNTLDSQHGGALAIDIAGNCAGAVGTAWATRAGKALVTSRQIASAVPQATELVASGSGIPGTAARAADNGQRFRGFMHLAGEHSANTLARHSAPPY